MKSTSKKTAAVRATSADYRMEVSALHMRDWKETLNLPRTEFPMKANLPASEPATIARWDALGLHRIREAAAARRSSSCTMGRRTRTAPSTSGTR